MRTRYLNVDFFRPSPSKTLEITSFPIPHLPAPVLPTEAEFPSFHLIFCNSNEINQLTFENALSQFLQEALPSICDEFQVIGSRDEKGNASSVVIEREENCRNFKYQSLELELTEKENELRGGEKNVVLETPEVDFPWEENVYSCDREDGRIHFKYPDVEIPLDVLEVKPGDTIPYPDEISRSVYSAEDITAEQHMDQNFTVADFRSVRDRTFPYRSKLLNFEVNEISLEPYSFLSWEDEFHSLLSHVGGRHSAEKHDLMVECKELMISPDIDILEFLTGHDPTLQNFEPQPMCLHSLIDMDFISPWDDMPLGRHSVISSKTSLDNSFSKASMIHFHEVEILDLASPQSSEAFDSSQVTTELETSGQTFGEDMHFVGSFYETIVNTELALVDDTFKSLPVPVPYDDKEIMYLSAIFEHILDRLKMQPASACDGIYLDWHLLQDNTCNSNMCSTYRELLEEVDTYEIASELKSTNERVVIDLIFYDASPDDLNSIQSKEILSELPGAISMVNDPLSETTRSQLLKDENQKSEPGEAALTANPEKISLLLESMSQFNDLKFFLKARKGTAGRNSENVIQDKPDSTASLPGSSSRAPVMICSSPDVKFLAGDFEIHEIKLSDHILGTLDNFQKCYFTVLENDTDLKNKHYQVQSEDNFKLLSLPKQRIMNLIMNTDTQGTTSSSDDETLMAYGALYAIKQMAYYLCFYGIHSTYLYISNLCQSLKYMKSKLGALLSLIEDAHWKAEKGITESHPSLSVVEEIMRLNAPQNGRKVLIVAERVFWWPLNRKLNSMSISFHEVRNAHLFLNAVGALDTDEFMKSILDALLQAECVLISHEHVFPSFLFNKFSIILEYGGSCSSPRISTVSSKLFGLPRFHFLKVKFEEYSISKAFCEGSDASQHPVYMMEGVSVPGSLGVQEIPNNQQLIGLLNFEPIIEKDSYRASEGVADTIEASQVPSSISRVPFTTKSDNMHSSMPSFSDIVIIVNTLSADKEMLMSRRSSYQKILAMEKGGVQVVEREFNLPVDLIFSAEVCLVWYDVRSFGISTTSGDSASSCIPECMENIATNILMSLSFAFSCCVLVFEGDRSFVTAIMEASDGLYAAAASLDMHLQIFCSYSSELTDEIILNCIKYATKSNQGPYRPMLESETLAESFLTMFPSINPLTAHAILSFGGTLVEFLEWSQEKRIQVIGKYNVPEESIALFSALCKYGELGESKSVMTDCSSALSSAVQPACSSNKIQSQRKKQKYTMNTNADDIQTAEDLQFEPLSRYKDASSTSYRASWPYQPRIFANYDEVFNKSEVHKLSQKDQLRDQKQGVNTFMMDDLDWNEVKLFDFGDEDVKCNTINNDNFLLDDDFSSTENTRSFPRGEPHAPKEAAENSLATRRSSLRTHNLPAFPTSAEIECDSDTWFSFKDHTERLENNIRGKLDIEPHGEASRMKRQGEFLEESKMQKSARNALGLSSRQKVTPPYGETPLSNPINSSQLKQGSPWTIEFLSRIKEKKERNQQSLPCNTCVNCSGSSKKIDKFFKRQSPSVIDSFRYQGGRQDKRTVQNKLLKQAKKPLHSVTNEKKGLSFDPTWTPIDKRARQSLSFARNGNERQSKLVWSDRNARSPRKRYIDE